MLVYLHSTGDRRRAIAAADGCRVLRIAGTPADPRLHCAGVTGGLRVQPGRVLRVNELADRSTRTGGRFPEW